MFQEVSKKFQECVRKVTRVCHDSFKGVSRVFERRLIGEFGSLMSVSMSF